LFIAFVFFVCVDLLMSLSSTHRSVCNCLSMSSPFVCFEVVVKGGGLLLFLIITAITGIGSRNRNAKHYQLQLLMRAIMIMRA
jgi:uncharacterized Tic20 family protein